MSCCGNQRQQISSGNLAQTTSSPVSQTIQPGRHTAAYFQYTGRTGMTVIGPVSGIRYRFNYPGECVFVDLRDRLGLLSVPNLKQVPYPE